MADRLHRRGTISRSPNRVASYEGIIDAFGHVSMCHPLSSTADLICAAFARGGRSHRDRRVHARQRTGDAAAGRDPRYGELVIHGEIYKAWPDVNVVAYDHSTAFSPFWNSGEVAGAALHMGAQIGEKVPLWDFGTSRRDCPPGCSSRRRRLARRRRWAGTGWRRCAARATGPEKSEPNRRSGPTYTVRNAEGQLTCKAQGHPLSPLTPGEAKMAWTEPDAPPPGARLGTLV